MTDQRKGGISWTEETWNVVRGCSRVSEGCRNCYAERVAVRMSGPGQAYDGIVTPAGRWTGRVQLVESLIDLPLRWRRPRTIFVNAMSDLFHEGLADEQIDRVMMTMAQASQHVFQVLTKRPERMAAYLNHPKTRERVAAKLVAESGGAVAATVLAASMLPGGVALDDYGGRISSWPLRNVWWGASAEDQKSLDARLPALLSCRANAAVTWLSLEPLIGPVDIRAAVFGAKARAVVVAAGGDPDMVPGGHMAIPPAVDWVVVGGESGPNARPMHPDWARRLRDECAAAGVPFHFKQWGEWAPGEVVERRTGVVDTAFLLDGLWRFGQENLADVDGHVDDEPELFRIGKRAAGRLLDGVVCDAMPAGPAARGQR